MGQFFIIFVATLTTIAAYQTTKRTLPTSGASIRPEIRALFEYIGSFAFFVVFNVAFGAAVILLVRSFTRGFLGVYELRNVLLLVLSAAQGFLFQRWWKRG